MADLSIARDAALRVLFETEKNGAYLNIALRDILKDKKISPRDKALATELATGVMRHKLYLDNIISHLSSIKMKKLSLWILNILRIGIYSERFLDKIPVSATVNECVRLARRYGHSASAGFVNAVLRKAEKSGDFLPQDTSSDEYLSIKYSLPVWLVSMWRTQGYGEELFCAMLEKPEVFVRLNTLKANSLDGDFIKVDNIPHAYKYTGAGSAENTEEFSSGLITVQDIASQMAVNLLGVKENQTNLDLCAAPGGKTTYMAQLMQNTGKLISCDVHEHKKELIENNLKRLGITNTTVTVNDASVFKKDFCDNFDCVLADVPCSGLGIIRRKPDIKWTKSTESASELISLQRQILSNAAKYVKKGGRLMFSTCTLNVSENEENVKYFLENNSDFTLIEEPVKFTPCDNGSDGFFAAVFERSINA